ncbi:MAG: hypothetical protein R3F40_16980 [Candidatus Competibacteraceae bacterium]
MAQVLPRLAPEDESRITVTVRNLSAPPGDYQLVVRRWRGGGDEPATFTFTVTDSATQNQDSRTFTLRGLQPGKGQVHLQITGPNGFQLAREADIGVRPAQTIVSNRAAQRLNPSETLRLGGEALNDYLPGTGQAQLSVASRPNLNVPELLAELDRYPYGCLEQTTSRALPLLYFNQVAQAWVGQNATEAGLRARVQEAIQRILSLQDAGGGFGLWSPSNEIEDWLSAYAMDFLVRARQEQYLVPEAAYQSGLKRLQERVNEGDFDTERLGWRAYNLYVLARVQKAAIGDLRYLHDNYLQKLPNALAQAQLGAALARYGELGRAREAFTAALNRTERTWTRDYGSPLRDRAAVLALLAEVILLPERVPDLADQVAADFNTRRYSSTQEPAWLLLAARALPQQPQLQLTVDGRATTADPFYQSLASEALAKGLTVTNQGGTAGSRHPELERSPGRSATTGLRRFHHQSPLLHSDRQGTRPGPRSFAKTTCWWR